MVRSFYGWADAPASGVSAPPTPPPPQTASALSGHPATTNYGCVGAFLAVFVAVGLGLFGAEVYRLYAWQATPARVLSTNIKSVRGSKGATSYQPVVRYQYVIDGRAYQSDRVHPITLSASRRWAESVLSRFRPGQEVMAYVNPSQPASAYLVHELSYLPLIFVAFPLLMFGALAGIVRAQRRQTAMAQAHPVPILEASAKQLP